MSAIVMCHGAGCLSLCLRDAMVLNSQNCLIQTLYKEIFGLDNADDGILA